LEAFASFHGPAFYGLPRNRGTLTLRREDWTMPGEFAFGPDRIVPLRSGEVIRWKITAPADRTAH
jgi:dihydroorotase